MKRFSLLMGDEFEIEKDLKIYVNRGWIPHWETFRIWSEFSDEGKKHRCCVMIEEEIGQTTLDEQTDDGI